MRHDGRHHWAPGCWATGKFQWPTARLARKHLRRLARRGYVGTAYVCGSCGWWHVAHVLTRAERAALAAREQRRAKA